jgi:hypothetical protein
MIDAAGGVTVTQPNRRPVTLEDAIASGRRWSEQSFNGGTVADSFDAIASAPSAPDEEYANALTIDDLAGIAGDLHAAGVDGPLVADIDEPGLVLGSMTAGWLLWHAVDVDCGDDYIGMSDGMVRTFPGCDARKYVEGFVDLPRTLRDWLALTDDQRQPMYHSSFAPERPGVALEDIARRVLASIEAAPATVADAHAAAERIDKE